MKEKTRSTWLSLGVSKDKNTYTFSAAVSSGSICRLHLYERNQAEPCLSLTLEEEDLAGEVRSISVEDKENRLYSYSYEVDGKPVIDPYAEQISGGKAILPHHEYNWEGDEFPDLKPNEVIAYSLHVKGFTRHTSSGVKGKGTFAGVAEKLPYLLDLGINQIHCMPVYEFFDKTKTGVNYWGFGPGYFFAPKQSYAAGDDAVTELKDLVKACHKEKVELILEMPFDGSISILEMIECLRFYRIQYHVDGFIINPVLLPIEAAARDPYLKKCKILIQNDGFQNVMRRFLKGDEGVVPEALFWLKHKDIHFCNKITGQTGFTLFDLVSYDAKHNEENGENNHDGPDYNYSWNCGAEGPSRKKAVNELRKTQMRNAFLLLLFGQGTPCILAGDEFYNTQKGNNNPYCQDNLITWLDWNKLKKNPSQHDFVKDLIHFRKEHAVFAQPEDLRGMDVTRSGIPDVSYHGEYAWRVSDDVSSRQFSILYCGDKVKDRDYLVIYNMHWLPHSFALPAGRNKMSWHIAATTKDGVLEEPVLLKDQHDVLVDERTILILECR